MDIVTEAPPLATPESLSAPEVVEPTEAELSAALDVIGRLPRAKQVALAEDILWHPTLPPLTDAQKALIDERLAFADAHPDRGYTLEEIKQYVRNRKR